MREIKFRAFDRVNKVMFPVHEMKFGKISDKLEFFHGYDIHDIDSDHLGDVFYGGSITKMTGNPLQPKFILMQYTGLKDKNGKEIYEGDVVTEHHAGLMFEPDFYQIQIVEWKEFGFAPFMRVIGDARHDFANNLKEFIIIGNIYENPELLKEGATC